MRTYYRKHRYKKAMVNGYLGRNGWAKCGGVAIDKFLDAKDVIITPLNGDGKVSASNEIHIPMTELGAVVDMLVDVMMGWGPKNEEGKKGGGQS